MPPRSHAIQWSPPHPTHTWDMEGPFHILEVPIDIWWHLYRVGNWEDLCNTAYKHPPKANPLGSQTEIFQVLVPLFGHLEVLQVCLAQFRDQCLINQQFGCTYGAMFQAYGLHSFFDMFSLVGTSKWVTCIFGTSKIVKLPALGNDGK